MRLSAKQSTYQELELFANLETTPRKLKQTVGSRLVSAVHQLFITLTKEPELRVWQTRDRRGQISWNAYDPKSGQSVRLASEAEMKMWIEQRYYQYRQ